MKQNAPGPRAEGVVCLLPCDIDAYSTNRARVQFLSRRGFPPIRAALLAPLLFGELAA